MRITSDVGLTCVELRDALEKLGLSIVRDHGGTVERGKSFMLDLARVLASDQTPYPKGVVNTDGPKVHRDEAVEHVVHHLMLAAMFFEATPDDHGKQIVQELMRLVVLGRLSQHVERAATNFVDLLDGYYEGLKKP